MLFLIHCICALLATACLFIGAVVLRKRESGVSLWFAAAGFLCVIYVLLPLMNR